MCSSEHVNGGLSFSEWERKQAYCAPLEKLLVRARDLLDVMLPAVDEGGSFLFGEDEVKALISEIDQVLPPKPGEKR